MSSQHLSDEAVAACADGVLSGHARARATRHIGECAECAHAVRVQREAAWALRAAPAPALPIGLLDRLRTVPHESPTPAPPTTDADGTPMLATFAPMAAIVAPRPGSAGPGGSAIEARPAGPATKGTHGAHRGWPAFSAAAHLFRSGDDR